MADNKLLREDLVATKRAVQMLKKIVGEEVDDDELEIQSLFPIKNIAELNDIETRITDDDEFAGKIVSIIN